MKEWTIKVFVDENGVSDFIKWRNRLPAKARAKMDHHVAYLEIAKDWTNTPYFRPLTDYQGIGEVRFTSQNVVYRPLGCRGPNKGEFTFLIGATERGNKFEPLVAPETAMKRKGLVFKDKRYSDEYV